MDLNNISNLIKVREYIVTCINNMNLDRPTLSALNKLLPLVDKKITTAILSDEFKVTL